MAIRSTRDLLNTLAAIAEAGAAFRSLGRANRSSLHTTSPCALVVSHQGSADGDRAGRAGEFERHLILARTDEGRRRAQARGVRFGRKLKLTPHQQQEALARRAAGEALVEIARSLRGEPQHDLKARVIKWARPVFGVQSGPFTTTSNFATSDHGYGKKSTSFRQLTAGNNQSLSSNFLASARNSGGNSVGSLYSSLRPWPIRAMTNHQVSSKCLS
jgi:hypothetical protein